MLKLGKCSWRWGEADRFGVGEMIKSLGLGDGGARKEGDKKNVQVSGPATWVMVPFAEIGMQKETQSLRRGLVKLVGYDEFVVLAVYPGG